MRKTVLAGFTALMLTTAPASAGVLVVGGDGTSTFSLDPGTPGTNEGNRAFYANVLGDAKQVLISSRSFSVPGSPSFANENLVRFYQSIGGVSVNQTANVITSGDLQGTGLLVVQFPNTAFTVQEATAIGNFVRAGGRLLLTGEASIISPSFPAPDPAPGAVSNGFVNDLLAGIGSTIRLGNDTIGCCGTFTASGSDIAANPLTTGVDSFDYGAVTSVVGGASLFYAPKTAGGPTLPFFATENLISSAVPEPGSWMMAILGFGLVGATMRRRGAGSRRRILA